MSARVHLAEGFAAYLAQGFVCERVVVHAHDGDVSVMSVSQDPCFAWRVARGAWPGDADGRGGQAIHLWYLDAPDAVARIHATDEVSVVVCDAPSSALAHALSGRGLKPTFAGRITATADSVAVVEPDNVAAADGPPPGFQVLAIVPTFNEADVIDHTLAYLVRNGVRVYVLDNWSTDGTVERAQAWLGRGVASVERFPHQGPTGTYDLRCLMRRVEQIAQEIPSDWYMLHDADERRESPWHCLTLRDALWRVTLRGFNAVDHVTLNFWPTDARPFDARCDVVDQLRYFEFSTHAGHFHQRRAWRNQGQCVNLTNSGGHDVRFPGRRVEPYRFLLRHYPIRSQAHGERKVLQERLPRFAPTERAAGWHAQYDGIGVNFERSRDELLRFDTCTFGEQYLVERLSGLGIFEQPPRWATPLRNEDDGMRCAALEPMVKKGQLEVSKMDSPRQGEKRDPDGPTPEGMRGHSAGAHGTAQVKRQSGSQSQRHGKGAKQ